ncbi:hypothetical protein [Piscibacillus salipiscarius]|uniref:hypothetical protein n=1 Tax=Piscibacillus salipiscarius TaxID=299480 RepID=UPI0006D13BE7|nr:hypothetical protein [Piscibacillus salipiscarius]
MTRRTRSRRNVAKIQTEYVQEHEEQRDFKAKQKKLLFRRLLAFGVLFSLIMGILVFTHINQRAVMEEKQQNTMKKSPP